MLKKALENFSSAFFCCYNVVLFFVKMRCLEWSFKIIAVILITQLFCYCLLGDVI